MGDSKRQSGPTSKMSRHNGTRGPGQRKRGGGGGGRGGRGGGRGGGRTKKSGPRLPAALVRQLETVKRSRNDESDDGFGEWDEVNDLYEYEEEVAEEDCAKNRRFDHVDNFEYRLPDNFQDEDVLSDDDNNDDHGEDDDNSDDDGRHARMLEGITGIPSQAFEGKKRKRSEVVSEPYPESEFNPTSDVLSGNGQISMEDLLDPLPVTAEYSKIRKRIQQMEKKGVSIQAPLPKPEQERIAREEGYEFLNKNLFKWEIPVKRNREASTLYFDKRNDAEISTVGALASNFKPRTDFEKKIASLVNDSEVVDAYENDGAKLLELNKISVEDVKERQDRLAKMRSLLFRHETKAKHIKKIKSKTYHRLKKKDRLKAASLITETDPEAARELAEKQERIRAEARMTMRHKNQGKWAKRVLERGLDKQDEGTRAAITEQLHKHNLLTRKMNSMKESSSSDDSSYEDDEDVDSSDEEGALKLLAKAKEKTTKLMEQEDEVLDSGVLSLPFMVRGLEKRKEAANEEAKRALEEYELALNQQNKNAGMGPKAGTFSGRRVFGAIQKKAEKQKTKHRPEIDNFYESDDENIMEENNNDDMGLVEDNHLQKDVNIDLDVLREGLETGNKSVSENVTDLVVEDPGPRTTYDVSVFTSGSWRKTKSSKDQTNPSMDVDAKNIPELAIPIVNNNAREEVDDDSDSDSGQMVDGMLSSGTKQTYELPSNEELIRRAFAGDDVEDEFQKAKEDVLNEENPEPEKPLVLPGWGQWTHVQKKRGLPSWMQKEHADAKRKREEALQKRKDARLKHVIISEKVDKKGEKLYAKSLPYPFTSKEVFEQSIRMPIGPEFNPATAAGALIRPEVVKKAGVAIDPIQFEEVNPHERGEDQKQGGRRRKSKSKSLGKKPMNVKRT